MNLPIPDQAVYLSAKPFPHCIVDCVFSESELQSILLCWPKEHEHFASNKFQVAKGHTVSEDKMGPLISMFIRDKFQSQMFILWLEKLTGITGIVADCRKFALHETFTGGSLMPHLDYTINKSTGLQLRVNVILYLNQNWETEYGGQLDLYEQCPAHGGTIYRPLVSIEPIFNRMAIFTMDAENPAWHGCAKPLNLPEGISRRSIACNYFTIPQKQAVEQRTTFSNERSLLKDWLPPVIYRKIRSIIS